MLGTPVPALVLSILAIKFRSGRTLGIVGVVLSGLTLLGILGLTVVVGFMVASGGV